MKLSVGDVRDARNFVEYAMESQLLEQARETIECQKNPKLLAVLSCNVEPALNAIIGMPRDQMTALCLESQVEEMPKQSGQIVPTLPSVKYMQNSKIPSRNVVKTTKQQNVSDLSRDPRADHGSNLPRQEVVDIRSTKRTYVGTRGRPNHRDSTNKY